MNDSTLISIQPALCTHCVSHVDFRVQKLFCSSMREIYAWVNCIGTNWDLWCNLICLALQWFWSNALKAFAAGNRTFLVAITRGTESLKQSASTSQGPELWQCVSPPSQPASSLDCQPQAAAQPSAPSLHPADCAETCSRQHVQQTHTHSTHTFRHPAVNVHFTAAQCDRPVQVHRLSLHSH